MQALNELKRKLENRENISATALCDVNLTTLPKMFKDAGLDLLIMDLEHGSFDPERTADMALLCRRVDLIMIARVQDCEYHCISKTLDMGADGVLIPRTETMEQVETAIQSMRLAPVGKKGVGGRALLRPEEIANIYDFNKNRFLFLQIESAKGVDLLPQMLEKYGDEVAGIIIGPTDMSVSLGTGLQLGCDLVMEYVRKTIKTCEKFGKSVGIAMGNKSVHKKWSEEGMNIFWTGTETSLMFDALKETCDSVKGL